MKTLAQLIDVYGSDKNASGYTPLYEELFSVRRQEITSVLEIGIGTITEAVDSTMWAWKRGKVTDYMPGASLRAWRDYFPNANITGGDIQPDTQFTEERITTLLFDSQDSVECHTILGDKMFDIIIDDGNHERISQIKTMYNLITRVKDGGFYVIEDITPGNNVGILEAVHPLARAFGFELHLLEPTNNLLVMKRN
jgi:hypothetical protein